MFKLTDLTRGAVRWVSTERISKKLAKSEVSQSQSQSYTYSFTPRNAQSSSNAPNNIKDFFSFGVDGKNHFIVGADFGLGGGNIKIEPIDFILIETYNPGYGKPTITTIQHSLFVDGLYNTAFVMPLNIRIGYFRDISDNWAIALNFLYSYLAVVFDTYGLKDTASFVELDKDSKKLTSTIHRIGGEFVIYYKALDWLHLYIGGGLLKDFSSKYRLSFEAYRNSSYSFDYAINKAEQRRFELEQKIDSWYPLVKVGVLWSFHSYIGATSDITCSWALKEANYIGTNCTLVLGLQFNFNI